MSNMDRSSIYDLGDQSGFQSGSEGAIDVDAPMPRGQMPPEFNSLPMSVDANSLIDGVEKLYTPLDTSTPNGAFASSTASIPLTSAGPSSLPPDFRPQSAGPVRNALAEFSRRRDFPQRIIDELEDFLHILTPDGRIVYLSPSSNSLTGYSEEELQGKFIIDFIHPDDSGIFMRDFNDSIAAGSPLHLFYRFRMRDSTYTIFECRGHPHLTSEVAAFGSNNAVRVCGGYFMMARPYPTKNATLLDSFLEHKIENERLRKRINDLKKEEAEEAKEEQKQWQRKQGQRSDIPLEEINAIGGFLAPMPSPPHFTSSGAMMMMRPTQSLSMNSSRRESVEDGNANRYTDPVAGNAVPYDDVTHIETIELLTGLNYQDGERSHGISTGDQSPILVRGDAGIAMPMTKDSKSTDKKKKIKLPEEYVCTDCGTLDSPEWRKGPSGPKTLCNACGLRWAKKEKRKSFSAPVPMMVYSGPR